MSKKRRRYSLRDKGFNGEYYLATNKQEPTPIERLEECEYGYLSQNNMKIILRMLINDRMIFD